MASLRAIEIFNDSRYMLVAIESVNFIHSKSATSYRAYGQVEPIAVIVCSSDRIYALNIAAEFTTLEQLRREIPELNTLIASANRAWEPT